MRSSLLSIAVPVLLLADLLDAQPTGIGSGSRQSCGLAQQLGYSLDFDGLAANGRKTASVRIWADSAGKLSYTEGWQFDSIPVRTKGAVWLNSEGLPYRYESEFTRGEKRELQRIERIDSMVVTSRGASHASVRAYPDGLLVPEELGVTTLMFLAQCAWHQPNRTLVTARGDTVRLREATTLRLHRPDAAPTTVSLFVVSMRGLNSYYSKVWLDDQGRYFATRFLNAADIVLPSAWRSSVIELLVAGIRAAEPRMRATAQALGQRAPAGIAIVNATILDVEHGRAIPGMSVFVDGSVIRTIQPDSMFTVPAEAVRVDAKGATLMPGLWDLDDREPDPEFDASGRRRLAGGVTSIQMLFADTIFTPLNVRRIDDNHQVAPRVFPGCVLDGWYPDTVPGAVPDRRKDRGQVRNAGEVRRLLRRCASLGMRWAMLNDNLPVELTELAVREAHRLGMMVTGNRLRGRSTADLIAVGFDQFEHSLQVVASFVDHDSDAVAWSRHKRGGINAFWSSGPALPQLDLRSADVQRVVKTMVTRKIGTKSTLCVYPPVNRGAPHDTTWDRASFGKLQELLVMLHRAGAPVFAATDGACDLITELELLQAAGFTNGELLRMATLDAAVVVGRGRDLGSIAVGKRADLVLVDGDPLINLASLRKVKAVMKDGTLYSDMDALRAALPMLLPKL